MVLALDYTCLWSIIDVVLIRRAQHGRRPQ